MKLNDFYGQLRIRLPASFYQGITSETDVQAFGVIVLNKLGDSAGNGANRPVPKSSVPSASSGSRSSPPPQLQATQGPRWLEEDTVEEVLAEVGTYTHLKDFPLFSALLGM